MAVSEYIPGHRAGDLFAAMIAIGLWATAKQQPHDYVLGGRQLSPRSPFPQRLRYVRLVSRSAWRRSPQRSLPGMACRRSDHWRAWCNQFVALRTAATPEVAGDAVDVPCLLLSNRLHDTGQRCIVSGIVILVFFTSPPVCVRWSVLQSSFGQGTTPCSCWQVTRSTGTFFGGLAPPTPTWFRSASCQHSLPCRLSPSSILAVWTCG